MRVEFSLMNECSSHKNELTTVSVQPLSFCFSCVCLSFGLTKLTKHVARGCQHHGLELLYIQNHELSRPLFSVNHPVLATENRLRQLLSTFHCQELPNPISFNLSAIKESSKLAIKDSGYIEGKCHISNEMTEISGKDQILILRL